MNKKENYEIMLFATATKYKKQGPFCFVCDEIGIQVSFGQMDKGTWTDDWTSQSDHRTIAMKAIECTDSYDHDNGDQLTIRSNRHCHTVTSVASSKHATQTSCNRRNQCTIAALTQ